MSHGGESLGGSRTGGVGAVAGGSRISTGVARPGESAGGSMVPGVEGLVGMDWGISMFSL